MLDLTLNEMIVGTAILLSCLIIALYILGHALRFAWKWVDRGESDIPHILDVLVKFYKLVDGHGRHYSTSFGGMTKSDNSVALFLTKGLAKKSLEKDSQVQACGNLEISPAACAKEKLSLGTFCVWICTPLTLAVVNYPNLAMWVISTVTVVFGSRYLRDLIKGLKKLKVGLDQHMEDKEAHTSKAQKVDTGLPNIANSVK